MYVKKENLIDICDNIFDDIVDYVTEHIDYDKIILLDVLVDYDDKINILVKNATNEYIFDYVYLSKYDIQIRNEIYDYLCNNYKFDTIRYDLLKECMQYREFMEIYNFNNEVDNFDKEYC